ncbi:MAG: hypothetical protein ABH845_03275 [Candidatus Omnitrophota bacterium]
MSSQHFFRILSGLCFGVGLSWFNFFLLKKWVMRLGSFKKPTLSFLLALSSRYVLLFFGIFVIVGAKWCDRTAGLLGLFGMYVGLLIHEFVKLRRMGD